MKWARSLAAKQFEVEMVMRWLWGDCEVTERYGIITSISSAELWI